MERWVEFGIYIYTYFFHTLFHDCGRILNEYWTPNTGEPIFDHLSKTGATKMDEKKQKEQNNLNENHLK